MNVRECTLACCYGTMGSLDLPNERNILLTSAFMAQFSFCLKFKFTCKQKLQETIWLMFEYNTLINNSKKRE